MPLAAFPSLGGILLATTGIGWLGGVCLQCFALDQGPCTTGVFEPSNLGVTPADPFDASVRVAGLTLDSTGLGPLECGSRLAMGSATAR